VQIHLIAVGKRPPSWVEQGYQEYAKRLPPHCALRLIEVPTGRHGKDPREKVLREEGERMLAAVPPGARVVALDRGGKPWSTEQLAAILRTWLAEGRDVALLVGGPEGLAPACRQHADELWSLSPLTLPHGLVRILVAEQIYRVWTILQNHPYHRGG
jgi:23S rRNA (pseudouridine1915-N3)-methyltransferase